MPQSILVADDEVKIVTMISGYLEASGFQALKAFNGDDALRVFLEKAPDCLILDINMPGKDGLAVAREIRRRSDVPIIFLTAKAEEMDRVVGLELGADDYMVKPFSLRELVARVRAVLRRSEPRPAARIPTIRSGKVEMDLSRRSVTVDGDAKSLTTVQFDILSLLMKDPGRVWTRLEILEGASGAALDGYERTIDAHIKNIRKALGDDSEKPSYIETVRGVGYRFMEQPA